MRGLRSWIHRVGWVGKKERGVQLWAAPSTKAMFVCTALTTFCMLDGAGGAPPSTVATTNACGFPSLRMSVWTQCIYKYGPPRAPPHHRQGAVGSAGFRSAHSEPTEPEFAYRENLSFHSPYRLCGNCPFSLYFRLSCPAVCHPGDLMH